MKRTLPGFLLASLTIFIFSTSCTRIETTDLGSDLIPAVDNVNTFLRVYDIESNNLLFNDTTRMYNQDHAIGIIANDPEFGRTEAITYVALEPATFGRYPFLNKDIVHIDSVVLSLAYTELYGDSNSIQQFEVREISPTTSFLRDSAYMITRPEFPVQPAILGTKTVNFTSLNDSIRYRQGTDTVRTVNELRIRLDTSFGRRFVNYDTTNAYKSDSAFKTFFKGLEIRAAEGSAMKNALAYFLLTDNNRTRLTFHCRVVTNGTVDTIATTFIHAADPHANIIKREPAGPFLAALNNAAPNDELIYLQSTPGSYAALKIPGLTEFADSNYVIHRAEIITEVVPSTAANFYTPPTALFLDAVNNTGDTAFTIINDLVPSNEQPGYDIAAFGGLIRNNKNYVFNITRYVQAIVTRKYPNYTLRLYAPFVARPYFTTPSGVLDRSATMYLTLNAPIASGRVILAGGLNADSGKKMKLRIIYSNK